MRAVRLDAGSAGSARDLSTRTRALSRRPLPERQPSARGVHRAHPVLPDVRPGLREDPRGPIEVASSGIPVRKLTEHLRPCVDRVRVLARVAVERLARLVEASRIGRQ